VTRDQQIRKALRLLAPPPGRRAECEHDIGLALDRVKRGFAAARSFRAAVSKKGKAGLRRYSAALRRLRSACNSLDPAIRPWLSLALCMKAIDLEREIKMAEALLDQRGPPPRRDGGRNKIAVAAAHDLLEWWGHKAAVTRGGKWAELAKILTDEPALDLFDHLRNFKRSPGPRVEKVRGAHSILYRTRRRDLGTK
jgi:hypothetical protein